MKLLSLRWVPSDHWPPVRLKAHDPPPCPHTIVVTAGPRLTARTVRNGHSTVSTGRFPSPQSARFRLPYSAAGEARTRRLGLLPQRATRRCRSEGPGGGLETDIWTCADSLRHGSRRGRGLIEPRRGSLPRYASYPMNGTRPSGATRGISAELRRRFEAEAAASCTRLAPGWRRIDDEPRLAAYRTRDSITRRNLRRASLAARRVLPRRRGAERPHARGLGRRVLTS